MTTICPIHGDGQHSISTPPRCLEYRIVDGDAQLCLAEHVPWQHVGALEVTRGA